MNTHYRADVARREDAVLVVIDVQERLAAAMPRRDEVVAATVLLIGVAALVGIPVVVTRQYPAGLGDVSPEIAAALADAEGSGCAVRGVDKMAFDCLAEAEFAEALAETGRSQLLITGMETHICVTQTALHAVRFGMSTHVVADACCSRSDDAHAGSLERVRNAGAVVSLAESVAYELVGAAGTDEFRGLLGMVKRRDAAIG